MPDIRVDKPPDMSIIQRRVIPPIIPRLNRTFLEDCVECPHKSDQVP
jgi:hypothetical protein